MDKVLGTTEGNSSLPGNWTNDGGNPSQMFAQAYTLTLTGAGYHTTPAPGAAGLIGLGGLLAARRRRA
jgi:MYXO-CTERM domain-containing protein